MRVAAFTKYGSAAASTRQRLLQFIPSLNAAGIDVECHSLLGNDYVHSLTTGKSVSRTKIAWAYMRRFGDLVRSRNFDLLWIYAELFPYLPASFEKLALRLRKPIIYDFDDAFFLAYESNLILKRKLDGLIAGAAVCCCGNPFLRDYALRLNPNAIVMPTVVDTDRYVPLAGCSDRPMTIGWIGSPTTWSYVRPILPVLERLSQTHNARFLAIGAGREAQADRFAKMELRAWCQDREVADIQEMDIGIMPLPDQSWTRGKSGFKLIQYMGCGLPVVASPVGVNRSLVDNGRNGFLANQPSEWRDALERLLHSSQTRSELGAAGREQAVAHYSLQEQAPRLIELFLTAAGPAKLIRDAGTAAGRA